MLWACLKEDALDYPHLEEGEEAVGRYRALFVAFGSRSQDILLRLIKLVVLHWAPCPRTTGGPRRQLAGASNTMDHRGFKMRWRETSRHLSIFSMGVAPSPRETGSAMESDQIMREKLGQERAPLGAQIAPERGERGNHASVTAGNPSYETRGRIDSIWGDSAYAQQNRSRGVDETGR